MAGNQSRGLVAASITRGWNPTVIPARDGVSADSSILPNFDRDQGNLAGNPVGSIPGGPPAMSDSDLGTTYFTSPQPSGNEDRRTTNADPNPGMPGAD